MRKILFLALLPLFACTKKVGVRTGDHLKTPVVATPADCDIDSNASISFSTTLLPIFKSNCGSCHTTPGAGYIDLDNYTGIADLCRSGQIMSVITNTDANSTMMPPPPYQRLDSCKIKAVARWMSQGYPNN